MVFVDESSLELEAVKAILPEVTVTRYDRERRYREFSCFHLKIDAILLLLIEHGVVER